jgi:hypothetical protein
MQAAVPPRSRNSDTAVRFVLPVSGAMVTLREPTGVEDLLLAEHAPEDPRLALALAQRLARGDVAADAAPDWVALCVADIDTLVVRLRQMLVGDRVVAEMTCASCDCRVDLSFGLGSYLAHHRPAPRPPRGRGWTSAICADAPGWHAVTADGTEAARFRLPALADQIAVYGVPDAAAALAARCIRPHDAPARTRARVEAAMAALAPPLAGPLQGQCPECGAPVAARFEARLYCLQELRDRARFVYDDVDTLAERYHWSERAILALPRARRVQYAERARQGLAA